MNEAKPTSAWSRVGKLVLFVALVLLSSELLLQVAALFASGRDREGPASATIRILCVGDSHTYGAGVEEGQSYPAQLQRLLDERWPGRFAVLNLGLPGMNTSQVRARLPEQVARYQPDLVVIWAGVNNVWNVAEREGVETGSGAWLEAVALRSRLYRMLRVALHERSKLRPGGVRQEAVSDHDCLGRDCPDKQWTLGEGGEAEVVRHHRQNERDAEAYAATTYRDLSEVQAWLERVGIPLILIRYPIHLYPGVIANDAIQRVGDEHGVPVLDTRQSVARVPESERQYLWATHPNGAMYGEVARDLSVLVQQQLGLSD